MRAGFSKPVGGVAGVGLLAMQNGVPQLAFRGGRSRDQIVGFFKARKIQPQTGPGGDGVGAFEKTLFAVLRCWRAGSEEHARAVKRDQAAAIAVEGQDAGDFGSICGRIEIFHESKVRR